MKLHRKIGLRLSLPVVALLSLGASEPVPAVQYRLSPVLAGGDLTALEVEVRFQSGSDGTASFAWQPSWQGDDRLSRFAQDVRFTGATSVQAEGSGRWNLKAQPNSPITASYRIRPGYKGEPSSNDTEQTPPVITNRWFYAAGEVLFGRPENSEGSPATFEWKAGGSRIPFASDLEHLEKNGGTVADVIESIVIGGPDLAVSDFPDSSVRVATVGKFNVGRPRLVDAAQRIVEAQRTFWGGTPERAFLITAVPLKSSPTQMTLGGTARGDAFALWIDENAPLERVEWLIAHENFHTWNPRLLGGAPRDRAQAASLFWFTEGFTDYYARALLVRTNVFSLRQFVDHWNEALIAYHTSAKRNASGGEIASGFRTDPELQQLAYHRGALLAVRWNAQLRGRSAGARNLDDIVRQQLLLARPTGPDPVTLFQEVARKVGLRVAPEIQLYQAGGRTISLPSNAFGPCAAVETVARPTFERGFDAAATAQTGVIAGVKPSSRAYAAGLRDGMRIKGLEAGSPGNSMVEYGLRVEENGRDRIIRYMPQGSEKIKIQQIRLKNSHPSCARSLGGA